MNKLIVHHNNRPFCDVYLPNDSIKTSINQMKKIIRDKIMEICGKRVGLKKIKLFDNETYLTKPAQIREYSNWVEFSKHHILTFSADMRLNMNLEDDELLIEPRTPTRRPRKRPRTPTRRPRDDIELPPPIYTPGPIIFRPNPPTIIQENEIDHPQCNCLYFFKYY